MIISVDWKQWLVTSNELPKLDVLLSQVNELLWRKSLLMTTCPFLTIRVVLKAPGRLRRFPLSIVTLFARYDSIAKGTKVYGPFRRVRSQESDIIIAAICCDENN